MDGLHLSLLWARHNALYGYGVHGNLAEYKSRHAPDRLLNHESTVLLSLSRLLFDVLCAPYSIDYGLVTYPQKRAT